MAAILIVFFDFFSHLFFNRSQIRIEINGVFKVLKSYSRSLFNVSHLVRRLITLADDAHIVFVTRLFNDLGRLDLLSSLIKIFA